MTVTLTQTDRVPESRTFDDTGIEVRQDGDTITLTGRAVVYNELSNMIYGFREKFLPGAFAKSLGGDAPDDVRALIHHERVYVIGRQSAGTLRLEDRADGLYFEIDLPNTTYARDLVESISRKDITGMSFTFRTIEDDWDRDEETGVEIRTVKDARIREISPVAWPAYPQTMVEAEKRAMDDLLSSVRAKLSEDSSSDGVGSEERVDDGVGGDGGGTLSEERREYLDLWKTQIELETGTTR